MSQCQNCRTDRDIEVAAAIGELRAEVRGLREDIKESLITQLKDHGKRIGTLERDAATKPELMHIEARVDAMEGSEKWRSGWLAGAGLVGGCVGAGLIKFVAAMWK